MELQEQQLMTLARKNLADLASLLLIHFTSRKTPQYTFQILPRGHALFERYSAMPPILSLPLSSPVLGQALNRVPGGARGYS